MDGVVRRKVGSAAPSTRIDAAREAFNNHSIEKTKAAHSAEQFAHKEEHQTEHGKVCTFNCALIAKFPPL
jgi:hypothetical protein